MKMVCIKTEFFKPPHNKNIKWVKNKSYNFEKSNEFESNYFIGYMETEPIENSDIIYYPIINKEISKYFITIDEYRNRKISNILNK
jgi:hypothetical protein